MLVWVVAAVVILLVVVVLYDVTQRQHAILRNFPVVGHFRYWLEEVGPELRQYIVTDNNEERPFSRDQRRWVYASSKGELNTFGFGTDDEMEYMQSLTVLKQQPFPIPAPATDDVGSAPEYLLPASKVLGGPHGRRHAFRPASVINISGMSYGALSPPAVEALNRGAALAPCLHNTGEGGLADAHRHGGELIFQIGTGYFGCRHQRGGVSPDQIGGRPPPGPGRGAGIQPAP